MDTRCDRSAVIRKIFMVARPPGSLPFSHTHHVVRDISKASPPLSLSLSVTLSQRNVRPDSSEKLSIDWFVCKGVGSGGVRVFWRWFPLEKRVVVFVSFSKLKRTRSVLDPMFGEKALLPANFKQLSS